MAKNRIRTLDFLPEVFQTTTNSEFLNATLDQLVNPPQIERIDGYIGSKFGYDVDATSAYLRESTKVREDYQLEPGVVFNVPGTNRAQDFISYPGIIDAVKNEGGITNDNDRLFRSQIYSWDSFVDLDKIVNYNQYYWIPDGPPSVTVSAATVFANEDYVVTDLANSYEIREAAAAAGGINPTLTLLRGGTYTFAVNQETGFWIQGEPGTSGTSATNPNINVRQIFGVQNNGAAQGLVTFNVPFANAQDEFRFPGNNLVDLVSNRPFNDINGKLVSEVPDIDGVTAYEGLTVMFYDTGVIDEIGLVNRYYDEDNYDVNAQEYPFTENITFDVASITSSDIILSSGFTTDSLVLNQSVTFSDDAVIVGSGLIPGRLYFISEITGSSSFRVSEYIDGERPVNLAPASPGAPGQVFVNQGLYEETESFRVCERFFRIELVGQDNPVIRLVPVEDPTNPTVPFSVPINEKITARFGTEYVGLEFYLDEECVINLVPYLSAQLDTLYYQDSDSPNKVGVIRLIESNLTNTLNIEDDILGKKCFTSENGVVFTNGLKVNFDGDVVPSSYLEGEYYVEGVGTSINLIPADELVVPENFSEADFIPFDTSPYDFDPYDARLYIPRNPDYITIARDSINRNAWSRSNRWFHLDVIRAVAEYNENPDIISEFLGGDAKARRPIIEFYPNLRLFNSGSAGKDFVDYIDFKANDALGTNQIPDAITVADQELYYPDIEVYTLAEATVNATNDSTNTNIDPVQFIQGEFYRIDDLGSSLSFVTQEFWAEIAGTAGDPTRPYYGVDSIIECVNVPTGNNNGAKGTQVFRNTTVVVNEEFVSGTFEEGQFISDNLFTLPADSQIDSVQVRERIRTVDGVEETFLEYTLGVEWFNPQNIEETTNLEIVASDSPTSGFQLFDGARIIFAADEDPEVRNKIWIAHLSRIAPTGRPVYTLSVAQDGNVEVGEQTVIIRGFSNQGNTFWYDGESWIKAQQKVTINQPPLFDVFDSNGISFGDQDVYSGSSFNGNKLFAFGIDTNGPDDPILGFPLRYSGVDNIGDISFDTSLNIDTFTYIDGVNPITQKVNTGYVYNYSTVTDFTRNLGWQPAVDLSVQYQLFNFDYFVNETENEFVCDILKLPALPEQTDCNNPPSERSWPRIKVYDNNAFLEPSEYVVTTDEEKNTTTVVLNNTPTVDTAIQVLLLSDQVSETGYYTVPVNLNNNPLNEELTIVNVGDIRQHYIDLFSNAPNTTGQVLGPNNYRDAGNLVPYGTQIIQNSASLALTGTFLRKKNFDLFDALRFNSREYIKLKQLIVNTVVDIDTGVFPPGVINNPAAALLDAAFVRISETRDQNSPFFWSDMCPSEAPFRSNTYTFNNDLDQSIYPLSTIYDFTTANYLGVLVYLIRDGVQTQLIKDTDYIVATDTPSLTVTKDLLNGDTIIIREYNQTYGSFVPNTPTKLGLYPASIPKVVYDETYVNPAYFIKGHDGSYTALYGEYDTDTGRLSDWRDQALLEFETRVYNNLKVDAKLPIELFNIIPGYFRDSDYSWEEFQEMYQPSFIDWAGQNRVDYQTNYFIRDNEFTYNFREFTDRLDNSILLQGHWRGLYQYYYDTTEPNNTPWEMLGFTEAPSWWARRYGPAPYTSDNDILWGDIEAGRIWNDGDPYIEPLLARPQLSRILPVDEAGELRPPLDVLVGQFNSTSFNRTWNVGDDAPAEFSFKRSSSWPFEVMRLFALARPAQFFNLAVDIDNYKFNEEFGQYLVNDRQYLQVGDIELYGTGTAKTSYLNWIIDFEQQLGVNATDELTTLLDNLDVRLVYRLAGYSDKDMLRFFVEKITPNSTNSSLLIPDESYAILLHDNQPFDKITYSSVIVQIVNGGYRVYGNSTEEAFFRTLTPVYNGKYNDYEVEGLRARVPQTYNTPTRFIPYGTFFSTPQELCIFLASYGAYLENQGIIFDYVDEFGDVYNWPLMINQFLFFAATGWNDSTLITLNPVASNLNINKDNAIVQPLTVKENNFILNQNVYPIPIDTLQIERIGTQFKVETLNQGDLMSYFQVNLGNFEHGIVFDNVTDFNDVIYSLNTGLRHHRILVSGSRSSDWNGTVNASGFILNQDNVEEWQSNIKYPKGSIVIFKNRYWSATETVEPALEFVETAWQQVDYDQIQIGLLPNSSTRAFEATEYYNRDVANLEDDANLLAYSLIGFRPRDYLALQDLDDVSQINIYQNIINNKGTVPSLEAFQGTTVGIDEVDYNVHENWAIKTGDFGGTLNDNFVEFNLDESLLTANPSIVSIDQNTVTQGTQQSVQLYQLYNYKRPITQTDFMRTLDNDTYEINRLYPSAGYANFNDVKMASYFYSGLSEAVDSVGNPVPLNNFYVRDYLWLASFRDRWGIFSFKAIGVVESIEGNANATATVRFNRRHGLSQNDTVVITEFNDVVNGYYVVQTVADPFSVVINLNIQATGSQILGGTGLGFTLTPQRVAQPSDIGSLDLLEAAFQNNTVWVDENNDGDWAVYRKRLNYKYANNIEGINLNSFADEVDYVPEVGYYISDSITGVVYRYTEVPNSDDFVSRGTRSGGPSFGTRVVSESNIQVISEPEGRKLYVYAYNATNRSNAFELIQTIEDIGETTDAVGRGLTLSGDSNFIYVQVETADVNETPWRSRVFVYKKDNVEFTADFIATEDVQVADEPFEITQLGYVDFRILGAVENEVGIVFTPNYEINTVDFVVGQRYEIVDLGTDPNPQAIWNEIADTTEVTYQVGDEIIVRQIVRSTGAGKGVIVVDSEVQQSLAKRVSYNFSTEITPIPLVNQTAENGEDFAREISTSFRGGRVVASAPRYNLNDTIRDWGQTFVYDKIVQRAISSRVITPNSPFNVTLSWTADVTSLVDVIEVNGSTNVITLNNTYSDGAINQPIVFSGQGLLNTGINSNIVYYIASINGNDITLKESRESTDIISLSSRTLDPSEPAWAVFQNGNGIDYLTVNGILVSDSNYGVFPSISSDGLTATVSDRFIYTGQTNSLMSGDLIEITSNGFTTSQILTSERRDRTNQNFGLGLDTNRYSNEILVGSPFEIDPDGNEGVVYRFTDSGAKYGLITSVDDCNVTRNIAILINGYRVTLTPGRGSSIAEQINQFNLPNIIASSTSTNRLIIQLVDTTLEQVFDKLSVIAPDANSYEMLGLRIFEQTQTIESPREAGTTQFGRQIRFNDTNSVVISAPAGTRFSATTFDFTDDSNLDNDTVFDNNATRFVDTLPNAGAVYMFDYLSNYNESLANVGNFTYAQSINDRDLTPGPQPLYGSALSFRDNVVMIASPNAEPFDRVTVYRNETGERDWSVFRQTSPIVDITGIDNTQIFSEELNETLINLDFIDPLQNKILGAVRDNLDYISRSDPASYNSDVIQNVVRIWGKEQVGRTWFNTLQTRWFNYHQNDNTYNAERLGTVFPGSNVAVYTWVESSVPPAQYGGPGTVFDTTLFVESGEVNAIGDIVPTYYFWVRNTSTISRQLNKTLSDTTLEQYIANPESSGIAFMAPILPNAVALYNCDQYVNAKDSIFHVGFATGTSETPSSEEYVLIRDGVESDFLPGTPNTYLQGTLTEDPEELYARFLDSFAGDNAEGEVVPDPNLPMAYQSGILSRPRQSFYYERNVALQNYVQFANSILIQYPIVETRPDAYFLFREGEFFDTTEYWQYVTWWAEGFNDSTKSALQVQSFSDLATLSVPVGTIATVERNAQDNFEVYRYDGDEIWTRIGLQNGTIQIIDELWNYPLANIGFDDDFFDARPFDYYPSVETRFILRALNEQIFIEDLEIFRNRGLILMFEYIMSEADENQNYLPWLNKTSLVDVINTARRLEPVKIFREDNQEFLEGYVDEVKPYHVRFREFLVRYETNEQYNSTTTDFDLPAKFSEEFGEFISPQLVNGDPENQYQYNVDSPIWSELEYIDWFENRGISLAPRPNYDITTLASYIDIGTNSLIVENPYGFPVNGVITIGSEDIAYSFVDRATGELGGLTRGFNDTPLAQHFPGDQIIIDLPAVIVLDGGTGYVEPPRVVAYYDRELYPEPIREAEFNAVLGIDSVVSIEVVDPGEGYPVLPEIRVDSAFTVEFDADSVNSDLNTIRVFAPGLATGDIVRYQNGEDGSYVEGLVDGSWYYINILEATPNFIISFYESFSDAINELNRIDINAVSGSTGMSISAGARASTQTSARPVRELNTTLRFDRTSYRTRVRDWEEGAFYGSFFAGISRQAILASSGLKLQSVIPPIQSILASKSGATFEIESIAQDETLTFSSFTRTISDTVGTGTDYDNYLVLVLEDGVDESNASGSTIGFYVGMPVRFAGAIIGGIQANTVYYVSEIHSDTDFSISETENGPTLPLNTADTGAQILSMETASVDDVAIMSVNYPDIRTATSTAAGDNSVFVPVTALNEGGTSGLYPTLPVFFTGEVFGGITENLTYYVNTVIDNERFTLSEVETQLVATMIATIAGSNIIVFENDLESAGFNIGDPVIFSGNTFGNIQAGITYYIRSIGSNQCTVSRTVLGPIENLTTEQGEALMLSQADTVELTDGIGSMTLNIGLPLSPGQINGQALEFYQTSGQFPSIVPNNITNLLTRTTEAVITGADRIALNGSDGGTDNFYYNLPIKFDITIGPFTAGTTYYVVEFTGRQILGGTTPATEIECIATSSVDNTITVNLGDSTSILYEGMPIRFSGESLGGILINTNYYVRDIIDNNTFTISETDGGPEFVLETDNGISLATGPQFIQLSETKDGTPVTIPSTIVSPRTVEQVVTQIPTFSISYLLGGYSVIVQDQGEGFAVDNELFIFGTEVGGTSPENDITITVEGVAQDGALENLIVTGDVPTQSQRFFVQVRSANTLALYYDQALTDPVNPDDIPFIGLSQQFATTIESTTDSIFFGENVLFELNDKVTLTGDIPENSGLSVGDYFVVNIPTPSTLQISETPEGTPVDILLTSSVNFSVAKAGSFAFLPEPFYFDPSLVRYNNRIWECIISNNDSEFILGKWEEVLPGDRRLNALDRAFGYYQPSVNQPGNDAEQLFEGVTFPNPTYFGNPFEPDEQIQIDTELSDQQFYPTNINTTSVLWDGSTYIGTSNTPRYSAIITEALEDNDQWSIQEIAGQNAELNGIDYNGIRYLATSRNQFSSLYTSFDGIAWATLPNAPSAALEDSSVGTNNWVAVGDNIYTSTDQGETWEESLEITLPGTTLFDVDFYETSISSVFVTVGKGVKSVVVNNYEEFVDNNTNYYSFDGITWFVGQSLTENGWYNVAGDGVSLVAVGENGIIYYSLDGTTWNSVNEVTVQGTSASTNTITIMSPSDNAFEVNSPVTFSRDFGGITAGQTYYIINIFGAAVTISETLGGPALTLENFSTIGDPFVTTYRMNLVDDDRTLRASQFIAPNFWITVGDGGVIRRSENRVNWTTIDSGTTEDLKDIAYNPDLGELIVVGDNNTILVSDDIGLTWTFRNTFFVPELDYDVVGTDFEYGYGPEEMVPGLVLDNLNMIVRTVPGSSWPVTVYSHTGFNIQSVALKPDPNAEAQTVYSFEDLSKYPAVLSIELLNGETETTSTIPETDYVLDWVNKRIIFNEAPIPGTGGVEAADSIIVYAYEVGNGQQIVKSNTDADPIRINSGTGLNEIYIEANYSNGIEQGNGIIQPDSTTTTVIATETQSSDFRIVLDSVENFVQNQPITFLGFVFGGIVENRTYFVKDIFPATNSIQVSETLNSITGQAGPVFEVTDATGTMTCVIEIGAQLPWTLPIMYHNGTELTLGKTATVAATTGTRPASVQNVIAGLGYDITDLGQTPPQTWASLAGTDQTPVSAIIVADFYVITDLGTTTDWQALGAGTNPLVGQIFQAQAIGSGDGLVGPVYEVGQGFFAARNGTIGDGDGTVDDGNSITVATTAGFVPGQPITFCDNAFGTIVPITTYYIRSLRGPTEFTITEQQWDPNTDPIPPVFPQSDSTGLTFFVTNDYGIARQEDEISARIVFAKGSTNGVPGPAGSYDPDVDYLVYSFFGKTEPEQFGYALPQIEEFVSDGSTVLYELENFAGRDNPNNAIVEVDGERYTLSRYTIDPNDNTLMFNFGAPPADSVIRVTTFNDTRQQYLSTQYGVTGGPGDITVTVEVDQTEHFEGAWDEEVGTPVATPIGSLTIGEQYRITNVGTTTDWNAIAGQSTSIPIESQGRSFQIGMSYEITVVGNTDFVALGAASNTVGEVFVATAVPDLSQLPPQTGEVRHGWQDGDIFIAVATGTGDGTVETAPSLWQEDIPYFDPEELRFAEVPDVTVGQYLVIIDLGTVTNWNGLAGADASVTYQVGDALVVVNPAFATGDGIATTQPSAWDGSFELLRVSNDAITNGDLMSGLELFFGDPTIGGIIPNQAYYVSRIFQPTNAAPNGFFSVSLILAPPGENEFVVFDDSGSMTGSGGGLTVAQISNISNDIRPYDDVDVAIETTSGAVSYVAFNNPLQNVFTGQTVEFRGTSFGGISTSGLVYFVDEVDLTLNRVSLVAFDGTPILLSDETGSMLALFGGRPTVRVTTREDQPHGIEENQVVRLDGIEGSFELNNATFFAHVITPFTVDLYQTEYKTELNSINDPITDVSTYERGGYIFLAGVFNVITTFADEITASNNRILVDDASMLVEGTPVFFARPSFVNGDDLGGNLVQGTQYFIREVIAANNQFTISETRDGPEKDLADLSVNLYVTQWDHADVNRLYVTVNGSRVPASNLTLNYPNELSILAPITMADEVIIGSMIDYATPDELVYQNVVNEKTGEVNVYNANTEARTWLTADISPIATEIKVRDHRAVTDLITQNAFIPDAVDGVYSIGIFGDKDIITSVRVVDVRSGEYIPDEFITQVVESLAPVVKISTEANISVGDQVSIEILEGNRINVNGEQIIFKHVDPVNNTLSQLVRGANGTGRNPNQPIYSPVYSYLSQDRLGFTYYDETWNSNNFNAEEGDPLQLSDTEAALFLRGDVT